MNFFEHQDKARKKTKLLIFYFLLAIVLIVLAINALVYGSILYSAEYYPDVYPLLYQPLWLYITVGVVAVILIGTLTKTLALQGGGLSVAKMVKARPINFHTKDFKEKQFINIVEEMSIASGVPIPKLFVLDNEPAINAFVAGIKPEDTVMVVTKGALEQLNREELQGVVGHEFSHIFNSDMRINIRLMSILAGILAIGVIGELLMRSGFYSSAGRSYRSNSSNNRNNSGGLAIVAIGAGIMVIGYIGLFFGRLIKAAISRQRELLADACSVQYTRYPQGLTSAFKRMQQSQEGSKLQSDKVEDISHLCFGQAVSFIFFKGLFATHPPLEKRIKAIDPKNQYSILADQTVEDASQSQEAKQKEVGLQSVLAPLAITIAAGALEQEKDKIKQSIGNPSDEHFQYAQKIHALIPEQLLELARDKETVELLYYALILTKFNEIKALHNHLKQNLSTEQYDIIKQMIEISKNLPPQVLIPLFDISLAAYTEHPPEVREDIFNKVEEFASHLDPAPFRFCMLTILAKKIYDQKNVSDKPKYFSFDPVENDIATFFSFILHFSYDDEQSRLSHFKELTKQLLDKDIEKPIINEFKPFQFRKILAKLNQLAPELKSKLINTCVDLILKDNTIKAEEAELLRAISECLDSPMPLLIF